MRKHLGRSDSRQDVCAPGETSAPGERRAANETYRAFIAIELPAELRKRVMRHIDHLRGELPDVHASWSREENLHLTLKFLGNVPLNTVPALSEAAQHAADRMVPFEIIVGGCGAFPPRRHAKVLWIGIDDPGGKLAELHQVLEDECKRSGFPYELRPFHPHLTIARLRKPEGSLRLTAVHLDSKLTQEIVSVRELVVFRSELRSEGSKHTAISRHSLRE